MGVSRNTRATHFYYLTGRGKALARFGDKTGQDKTGLSNLADRTGQDKTGLDWAC